MCSPAARFVTLLAALLLSACGAEDANRARAVEWLDALLIEREFDRFDELFARGALMNGSSFSRAYLESLANGLHAAFPDLELEVVEQIARADRVVTRFELHGTHEGEFNTFQPTGRRIDVRGVAIDRLHDGQVTESWLHLDLWTLVRQLMARDGSG